MGASQSTGDAQASADTGEVKTSYYLLLGVERDATQDELKKAYRKKALELHPDRNYGDVERATALFAEVRNAYEVLSDEQERAWYDAHEGTILRGGTGEEVGEDTWQGDIRMTTSDELARMMGKFRGNVDFTDSPNGFFGFVRETFEQLAKEEAYAAAYEDIEAPEYPTFGHKDDTYEGVVRDFYTAWNGFATVKNFAWLDRYQLSRADYREERKAMAKLNQKLRDEGRKDFNEAVRALVAFVRKRDPRYTPQTEEQKAKAQKEARKAQAARARAAQIAKLDQEAQELPEWATARPADELEEETEEEVEEDLYECVACNKTFKSERQYDAHEKSKKHQKAIQALKWKMQKDNAKLDLDKDAIRSGTITPAKDEPVEDEEFSDEAADDAIQDITKETEQLNVDDDSIDEENGERPEKTRLADFSTNASCIDPIDPETPTSPPEPKMGKAAQKRAKRAAKQAEVSEAESNLSCAGCSAAFPSKNQLYQHLKKNPKHAALKPVTEGGKKGKKKK
ncbi:DnaJ domain containing protein [Pyrenophora tritici-repentis]|nr:DnaJ domain-containing protein [Pyrenophora tritici-repentis]KAF7451645.1 DnaJ domain containing protein [Pyrenophora tritici-repentis]KAG9386001.1 DnaJ domain containing protein [Pyrenophora tritici-repentis]KAI0582557.1 DnaJ domain-containing protein [Pyrenophora tritici-repentis]KAI0609242.1 DnaJ domain-containing protein [Pyrenophora tritici-repentis]